MNQPPTGPTGFGQAAETSDSNEEDDESSPITRGAVLASALAIIDRDGVDGLSMRRLGEAVRRDPMVLYRHVPNKAAVLDGVVELVFDQLSVDATNPDWAAALRALAHDFRELARKHPNVVPLLVTRPLATPLGMRPQGILRPLESVLALLTAAGFSGVDALQVYRALFGLLYGHVLTELQGASYDLPYTTGPLARQYLLTLRTVCKLALPDRFLSATSDAPETASEDKFRNVEALHLPGGSDDNARRRGLSSAILDRKNGRAAR